MLYVECENMGLGRPQMKCYGLNVVCSSELMQKSNPQCFILVLFREWKLNPTMVFIGGDFSNKYIGLGQPGGAPPN